MACRLGVFGGTFDPIHLGHLVAANQVSDELALTQTLFVPAASPWQKSGRQLASIADRVAMCECAVRDNPRFSVSLLEADRPGPTYTIDTLRELRVDPNYRNCEIFFLVGADALAGIDTWRGYPELLDLATFVGISRPGHPLPAMGIPRIQNVTIEGLDISSSQVRSRVEDGSSVADLLPWQVVEYIQQHGLYRQSGDELGID